MLAPAPPRPLTDGWRRRRRLDALLVVPLLALFVGVVGWGAWELVDQRRASRMARDGARASGVVLGLDSHRNKLYTSYSAVVEFEAGPTAAVDQGTGSAEKASGGKRAFTIERPLSERQHARLKEGDAIEVAFEAAAPERAVLAGEGEVSKWWAWVLIAIGLADVGLMVAALRSTRRALRLWTWGREEVREAWLPDDEGRVPVDGVFLVDEKGAVALTADQLDHGTIERLTAGACVLPEAPRAANARVRGGGGLWLGIAIVLLAVAAFFVVIPSGRLRERLRVRALPSFEAPVTSRRANEISCGEHRFKVRGRDVAEYPIGRPVRFYRDGDAVRAEPEVPLSNEFILLGVAGAFALAAVACLAGWLRVRGRAERLWRSGTEVRGIVFRDHSTHGARHVGAVGVCGKRIVRATRHVGRKEALLEADGGRVVMLASRSTGEAMLVSDSEIQRGE
jgi:hypothetical protein